MPRLTDVQGGFARGKLLGHAEKGAGQGAGILGGNQCAFIPHVDGEPFAFTDVDVALPRKMNQIKYSLADCTDGILFEHINTSVCVAFGMRYR